MIILSKLSKQAPTSQAKPEQGEGVEEKKKKREGGEKKKCSLQVGAELLSLVSCHS